MVSSIRCLKHTSITRTINRIDSPGGFLANLLYPDSRDVMLDSENVEIGTESMGRICAPYVREGSAALMMPGRDQKMADVQAPHIRIKKPFNPGDSYFNREPGESPFERISNSKMQRRVAKDAEDFERFFKNTEELQASQTLQGVISFEQADQDAFDINYNKPVAHDVTLAAGDLWTASTAFIEGTFRAAKKTVARNAKVNVTHCIMSEQAADAFLQNEAVQLRLDRERWRNGSVEADNPFLDEGGANFLGVFMGVRCWEYVKQLSMNGSAISMIRDNYVEFISVTRGADWTRYYGAITDIRALQQQRLSVKRFGKSWVREDPSSFYLLASTRPLSVPRRPDAVYSVQVVV